MKILVTGAKGQLGHDVIKELKKRNQEPIGVDREEFNICDEVAVKKYLNTFRPNAVIHCAAYTAVDKAEDEPDLCAKINVDGTKNIAEGCRDLNIPMMYISTDYVFSGEGDMPYEIDSLTGALSVYGRTKLEGEQRVRECLQKYFIVRISWVFGINGNNFVKTMLRLAHEKESLNIVHDQVGSPTYTADVAVLLCDMIATEKYGIYHATNEGFCSWAEFAEEVFRVSGNEVKINRITTEEYPTKAKRPQNSRLSKVSLEQAGFKRLPEWKDAVRRFQIENENL